MKTISESKFRNVSRRQVVLSPVSTQEEFTGIDETKIEDNGSVLKIEAENSK